MSFMTAVSRYFDRMITYQIMSVVIIVDVVLIVYFIWWSNKWLLFTKHIYKWCEQKLHQHTHIISNSICLISKLRTAKWHYNMSSCFWAINIWTWVIAYVLQIDWTLCRKYFLVVYSYINRKKSYMFYQC